MIYELELGKMKISADENGAELHSLNFEGREYLWQCGKAWERYAPILFPFICSPKDRTYMADGKEYKMKGNHGFARDSVFTLKEKSENSLSFILTQNEETLAQYPYKFELTVTYEVEGNAVTVINKVKNTDDRDIYFYIGGHPAFNAPLSEGESFEDYYVEYADQEKITQKVNGETITVLDHEKRIDMKRSVFDNDALILANPNSKSVSLRSKKNAHSVTVEFPMSECIAVWSPTGDDNATFVCLEPWTSVPTYYDDDFFKLENKPHAISLEPGAEYEYRYRIVLE
ncbi:MAG: aldose 1-epimerase family protein [Ruminococcus sp.]|nr:aldose 1-epimerase family protein [Ruminococcus sp.]